MLNLIWAFMILVGVVFSALTGSLKEVTEAALNSAKDAVSLCITMTGVMSLWMGLMKIAEKSGILAGMTRWISPLLSRLFPRVPKDHAAMHYIATNFIANVLGLGWAATPAGLKAMEELAKLKKEQTVANVGVPGLALERPWEADFSVASPEMCNFLILNVSSLQLIPVNMIAYRSEYGSQNPTLIIAPAIVATLVSTMAAIIFIMVMDPSRKKQERFLLSEKK